MGALSAGNLLGTLTSAATAIKTLDSTVNTLKNFGDGNAALKKQQNLALDQLKQQQALSEANAAADAALQKQQIAASAAAADATRLDSLRRAVARQNAAFGAQGISGNDGSGEAVLLGLVKQSDQDQADADALDTLRTQAIDQNLAQQNDVDVLQRTQLQEKQSLARALADY